MKNKFLLFMLISASIFAFVSCEEDTNDDQQENVDGGTYIINYGSYSSSNSTISSLDTDSSIITNNYYNAKNGVDLVSKVQYAYEFNEKIYMMGNNVDGIFWVDHETFIQTENAVTDSIIKPRYCVGEGDFLYVSCWGGEVWKDSTLSYIAKFNIMTNTVEKKIMIESGPEGLAIANGKLYAALNYKDSVAVMDLSTEAISYIKTPSVSSYFEQDASDNLYVSLTSYGSDGSLGYINTTTDELEATYALPGISTSYNDIMEPNTDFSKLYLVTSAYDANWNLTGAIATFDVTTKSFETDMFLEGISGINGIAFTDDKLYYFVSETVTGNGSAISYLEDGTKVKEYETGIAPFMMLTVE